MDEHTIEGNVETSGGDFIGGDQTVYGDEVSGDKVLGNKIVVGDVSQSVGVAIGPGATANVTIQQTLSEADIQDQNNRHFLRQMVKKFWIEDVLEHSLNREAAICLNLADRSTMVENRPWKLLSQQPDEPVRLLPPETHILDVFDQMNQRLLILGEPGGGKTTLLLELARALLQRADETPGYPSPVVFNLSSWIERKAPLAEWLVDELRTRYTIPKKMALAWVAQDKLLPLLDGLDEVQTAQRAICAKAINQFHAEHLVPLVVCSRVTEYENLTVRLKLQGAVLLQPLTTEQVDMYLANAGSRLLAVRGLLQRDPAIKKLAESPLMLSVMVLTYQDKPIEEMPLSGSPANQRERLFNAYIDRMFTRRAPISLYTRDETMRFLTWLSRSMLYHGQTTFLMEKLDITWVESAGLFIFSVVLILGLIIALILLPSVSWSINGLVVVLLVGLIGGLVGASMLGRMPLLEQVEWSWKGAAIKIRKLATTELKLAMTELTKILIGGLGIWMILVLLLKIIGLMEILTNKLGGGWIAHLIGFLIFVLVSVLVEVPVLFLHFNLRYKRDESSRLARQYELMLQKLADIYRNRLLASLFCVVTIWLQTRTASGLTDWLIAYGNVCLAYVVYAIFGSVLIGGFTTRNVATKFSPNEGIHRAAKNALTWGSIFGLIVALLMRLMAGLNLIPLVAKAPILEMQLMLLTMLIFGYPCIRHIVIRLLLYQRHYIPFGYAKFLDYCADRIFLRKVGGGYIFVHRLIMEHFAGLNSDLAQVREFAYKLHAQGQPWRGDYRSWPAHYTPEVGSRNTPNSEEDFFPATFEVGDNRIWSFTLCWWQGAEGKPKEQESKYLLQKRR